MRIKGTAAALLLATGLTLGGCATGYDRYGYGYDRYGRYGDPYNRDQLGRTAAGAAIGAGVGAAIGGIVDGVSPGEGAAVGALGGAIVGATSNNRDRYDDRYYEGRGGYVGERRWYRDRSGYCFFYDRDGRRIYDRNVRC